MSLFIYHGSVTLGFCLPPQDKVSQSSQNFAFLYFTVPKSTIFSRTKLHLSLIFQFFKFAN